MEEWLPKRLEIDEGEQLVGDNTESESMEDSCSKSQISHLEILGPNEQLKRRKI